MAHVQNPQSSWHIALEDQLFVVDSRVACKDGCVPRLRQGRQGQFLGYSFMTGAVIPGVRSAIRAGPYRWAGGGQEVAPIGEHRRLVLPCSDRSVAGSSTEAS